MLQAVLYIRAARTGVGYILFIFAFVLTDLGHFMMTMVVVVMMVMMMMMMLMN